MFGKGVRRALKQVAGATALAALLFSGGLAPSAGLDDESASAAASSTATDAPGVESSEPTVVNPEASASLSEPAVPQQAEPTTADPAPATSPATADAAASSTATPLMSQKPTPATSQQTAASQAPAASQSSNQSIQPKVGMAPMAVGQADVSPPFIRWTATTSSGQLVGGASFQLEIEECFWLVLCSWTNSVVIDDCVADTASDCVGRDRDPDAGAFTLADVSSGSRYRVTQVSGAHFHNGAWYERSSSTPAEASWTGGIATLNAFPQRAASTVSATVRVNTADFRTATTNAGYRADYTVGARFGLYLSNTDTTPIAVCQVSAPGSCSVSVNVPDRTQLWVGAIAPAPGTPAAAHYGDPITQLTTGTNDSFVDRPYRYQTSQLRSGRTYTVPTDAYGQTPWDATSTRMVNRLANPSLNLTCEAGVKVALVIDLSGSIAVSRAENTLQDAALGLVESLRGTGSRMALFSFGDTSPRANTSNVPNPLAVDNDGQRETLIDRINNYRTWTVTDQGTNWDAGLLAASGQAQNYDVVIVLTDGNPTFSNIGTRNQADNGSGSLTAFRELERAVMSANVVKAKGARVVAVGVGGNLSDHNLAAISGPQGYEPGLSLNDVDYTTAGWEELGTLLQDFARGLSCQAEVVVEKLAGDTVQTVTPAGGWEFAAATTGTATVTPAATQTTARTDAVRGTATWNLAFTSPTAKDTVTLTELSEDPAWHLADLKCTVNGAPVQVAVARTATIAGVGVGDTVRCTFTNVKTSALTVAKQWVINDTAYAHGQQPAGFDAALTLTGPGSVDASAQEWGVARTGYRTGDVVRVAETTTLPADQPGCVLVSSTIRPSGSTAPGVDLWNGHDVTLTAGHNKWTVTNTVACTTLTLVKELEHNWGGTSQVSDWVLTAAPTDGDAVEFASGEAQGVAAGEYTVAEVLRTERTELASGYEFSHISCIAGGQQLLEGDPEDVGLTVDVPQGEDTVCVLTNTDLPGSAKWAKVDEQQRPLAGSIWELTRPDGTVVEVTDLAGEQGQGSDTDREAGAFHLTDLAWGTYQLREKQAPAGYRLAEGSVEFTVGPEGDGLDVVFTEAFVNEPHDSVVLPLTGGTARDVFTLAGGGLLAGALLLGLVFRRRKVAPRRS